MADFDTEMRFSPLRRGLLVTAPMACIGAGALGYRWYRDQSVEPVDLGPTGPFTRVYVRPNRSVAGGYDADLSVWRAAQPSS